MTNRKFDARSKSEIGKRLELTRRALGLAQGEFAERASLSRNAYNQYETGTNRPQLEAAFKLCDTYRLTLDWIYFGDPSGLRFDLAEAIKVLRKVEI